MEFEAGFLGNTDVFTAFFGQDDYFSLFQTEQKNHTSIENVLVEKLSDYGVNTGPEIDTNFGVTDSLFDNEWMTSKIDLSSCYTEQLDGNLNLVDTESQPTSSTVASLLGNTSINVEKIDVETINVANTDVTNTSNDSVEESVFEDYVPISPEQHVPDVDGIDDQFKVLLDSYLAAAKSSVIEDTLVEHLAENDIAIDMTNAASKLPLKRKMAECTAQGPKVKVKTPEQKQRKRLQNRNAATKYRSKKRGEQETLNAQCVELEDENAKLQKKIESKQQEIQYLKNLIIDVFSKKPARI